MSKDVPISIQEAMLLWGKGKKAVWWAIHHEKIKARQSVCSQNWILSFDSCASAWGSPIMEDLAKEIEEDWNG